MSVWVVKGGRHGQHEDAFLAKGVVSIGFGVRRSIADFADREALREHAESRNGADQLWRFYQEVSAGDMVVLPRKRTSQIAIGQVSGPYAYQPEAVSQGVPHLRGVKWQVTDIPRAHFDRDLLNSFGSQLTLSQPGAPDAEGRIERIAGAYLGTAAPDAPLDAAPADTSYPGIGAPVADDDLADDSSSDEMDPDREVIDRIIHRLRRQFAGTRLEYLVASILDASGYYVRQTRQGADGGIDVLAGKGDLGFDNPRLCVQVKGRTSPVSIDEYSSLQGNIDAFRAQHGLFVSLGGFTKPVHDRNEGQSFFQIRLWGPEELARRLIAHYAALPPDIRAEFRPDIPLGILQVLRGDRPEL